MSTQSPVTDATSQVTTLGICCWSSVPMDRLVIECLVATTDSEGQPAYLVHRYFTLSNTAHRTYDLVEADTRPDGSRIFVDPTMVHRGLRLDTEGRLHPLDYAPTGLPTTQLSHDTVRIGLEKSDFELLRTPRVSRRMVREFLTAMTRFVDRGGSVELHELCLQRLGALNSGTEADQARFTLPRWILAAYGMVLDREFLGASTDPQCFIAAEQRATVAGVIDQLRQRVLADMDAQSWQDS